MSSARAQEMRVNAFS